MHSSDSDSDDFDQRYSSDSDSADNLDHSGSKCNCKCKKCYHLGLRGRANELRGSIEAYYDRNYSYWFTLDQMDQRNAPPETPEERAFVQVQSRELIRRNRYTVMTHRGFRVSFPDSVDVLSSLDYRHSCPKDEEDEKNEKMHQLVQQGIWNEELKSHYANLIDDFWYNMKHYNTPDRSAFPRHHALVAASSGSSITILERVLWGCRIGCMRGLTAVFTGCAQSSSLETTTKSRLVAQKPASSVFTETTNRQRATILAYSGIVGIAISRLFGRCGNVARTKQIRRHAFLMTQRVHSNQACEILVGNRYQYRGEIRVERAGEHHSIKSARAELREVYSTCIEDLKYKAMQYRRGFIDVREIHSNPNFKKLYSLLIFCGGHLMNLRNKTNDLNKPKDSALKRGRRIMKFIAEFPGLYDVDVARAFGTSAMRLRMSAVESQLRIANEGCYAALLSFAVLEPSMVDEYLAPEVSSVYGGIGSPKCLENHVASRNKILGGDLLNKYRHHIPRTADVVRDVCRKS